MRKLLRSPLWLALLLALAQAVPGASEPLAHMYWNVVYSFGSVRLPMISSLSMWMISPSKVFQVRLLDLAGSAERSISLSTLRQTG
jgi:hypothetical protein